MAGRGESQVLVVGAGPVGLFAALLLARRGIGVEIVDAEWRTGAHSYALALHPGSLKLLDEAGLAGELLARGYRVRTIGWYDRSGRRGEMSLSRLGVDFPFVLALRQDVLESLLEQHLGRQGVAVRWNRRVCRLEAPGQQVVATVEELGKLPGGYAVALSERVIARRRELRAAFVIGADGHESTVRRSLDIEYRQVGPAQVFAVFEFQCGAELGDEMRVVLAEQTTSALWPLPGGRCRWSFQLPEAELPASERAKSRLAVQLGQRSHPYLTRQRLEALLRARAPWFEPRVGEVNWSAVVGFERRLAACFGRDRVWLAGDAAHLTGPVGMQSMNAGLREAHELAWRLARVLRRDASPELLEAYSAERLSEWRQLLGIEAAPVAADGAAPWVRRQAARILPCIPACGAELAHLARQLGLRLSTPAAEA